MPNWLVPPSQKFSTYAPGVTVGRNGVPLAGNRLAKPGASQHVAFVPGRGYMLAPGAGPTPVPKPKPTVKVRPRGTARGGSDPLSAFLAAAMQTPAQIRAQANASVNDQIKLALADQQRAYDQARLQGEQQALGARNAQQAVIDATAGDPAALQAGYLQAADRTRLYGQGLAGDVLAAENANVDKSNAAIQALGAPGGPIKGYDTAALNNAALMRNVVNPGMALEDQAAGALQLGQGLRQAQIGTANQGLLDIYGKLAELRKSYLGNVADVEGKRPTLLSQALNDAMTQYRQNLALYASSQAAAGTQSNKTSLINTRTSDTSRKNRDAQIKATGIDPKTNYAAPGYYRDPNDPAHAKRALKVGTHWDVKTGRVIKDKTPGTKGSSSGPKPADFAKTRAAMLKGGTTRLGLGSLVKAPLQWSRKQISAYLMKQWGEDFILSYPGQRKRIQSMVDEVATTLYNQSRGK